MKLASVLVVFLLAGVTLSVAAEAPWAIKGTTMAHTSPNFVRNYPVLGADGATVVGSQAWRVANNTGNCCENHISVTPSGRIIDVGATVPVFSDDEGATWQKFIPTGLLPPVVLGAEGSGSNAPNGDWVGMTWDPQWADRVIAFKYVAAEDAWYSSHVALHGPFYDRPWIGVIAGPITFGGETHPYAVLLRGGWPTTTSYLSFDGLTYALVSPGDLSVVDRTSQWLSQPSGAAWADFVHPIASSRVVPLPGGGALAVADHLCGWALVEPDASMHCFSFPTGGAPGLNSAPRFDSEGRLHLFEGVSGGIRHRMSSDGGQTWTSLQLPLPARHSFRTNMIDSAVNGALDMAVVGVRAEGPGPTGGTTSKIIVHRITNLSTSSPDVETFQVGNGDRLFSQGVTASVRMDFMTLGLLPDGRIVTTFGDGMHAQPRVAVEMP